MIRCIGYSLGCLLCSQEARKRREALTPEEVQTIQNDILFPPTPEEIQERREAEQKVKLLDCKDADWTHSCDGTHGQC